MMDSETTAKKTRRGGTQPVSNSLDHWLEAKIPVRYNVFTHQCETVDSETREWREIRDSDSVEASFRYERSTGTKASSSRAHETIRMIALRRKCDPLVEHLSKLPVWDGQKRLDTWLVKTIGAEDTPYTRLVSRKWLIAAIARALDPGCKVDNVLIMHGKQGKGKSKLLRDLASPDFFSEDNFDFGNAQKAGLALRGTWIHEWAELDNMSRATHTQLKSFISERLSRFRPPYGREMVVEPRRCVFAGSSNKDDFLTDSTGNRRFWPVKTGTYQREVLLEMRDQLLAEAKMAFHRDEDWWLTPEQETLALEPRELVEHEDAWTARVVPALKGREKVHILELLEDVLLIPTERIDIRQQGRVAGILRKAGWCQGPKEDGKRLWIPEDPVR